MILVIETFKIDGACTIEQNILFGADYDIVSNRYNCGAILVDTNTRCAFYRALKGDIESVANGGILASVLRYKGVDYKVDRIEDLLDEVRKDKALKEGE